MSHDDNGTCSERLKVIADETRLAVLRSLLDGPKRVAEINEPLGVEQTLLSHHLRVLREAGMVVAEREGKGVRYSLSAEAAEAAKRGEIDLGCCRLKFPSAAPTNSPVQIERPKP